MMLTKLPILLHVSRKTLVNGLFITVSRVANYLLLFVFTMINARTLGVSEYGRLSYCLAVTGIMAIFFTMGMDIYIVIQIAKEKSKAIYYLNSNFINRTVLILGFSLIFLVVNRFLKIFDWDLIFIMLYVTMIFDSYRTVVTGFLQAIEEMHYIALFDILRSVVLIIVFLILRAIGLTIIGAALAYLISSLVALLPGLWLGVKKYQFKFQVVKLRDLQELLANSFPFFLNSMIDILARRTDLVMINRYLGNMETGYYNSAKKLYETTLMVPNIMTTLLLPKLSNGSIDREKRRFLIFGIFIVGLGIGIGIYFLAGLIVALLFGKQFGEAGYLLQVMVIGIPLVYLNYFFGSLFAASGERKKLVFINILGTLFNIGMNLLLIPRNRVWGAALVVTLSAIFTCFLNFYFYNRVNWIAKKESGIRKIPEAKQKG
jgi:O-antigen/teichoic acid export membrane protein